RRLGIFRLIISIKRQFPRWPACGSAATTPAADFSPRKVRLQGFPPKKLCRYSLPRGLKPPHETLLHGSSAAIGPRGALGTHGDDVQTALSVTANLTPRHTPAAAAQCG